MAFLVRQPGTYTSTNPHFRPAGGVYVNKSGAWQAGKKVFIKKAGAWKEVWPRNPNPPRSPVATTAWNGTIITNTATWILPVVSADADLPTKFRVRCVFRHPTTNAIRYSLPFEVAYPAVTYTFLNDNLGWIDYVGWRFHVEVASFIPASDYFNDRYGDWVASPEINEGQTPFPPDPASVVASVSACNLTTSWTYTADPRCTGFEIQVWLTDVGKTVVVGSAPIYTASVTARSYVGQPWDPLTVGRHTVNVRVRATGPGGKSDWFGVTGIMPGDVDLQYGRFTNGVLQTEVHDNLDGFAAYRQKYGASSVFQLYQPATGTTTVILQDSISNTYAADNATKYRLLVIPRTFSGAGIGWTGRTAVTNWMIKVPNPLYIKALDCSNWVHDWYYTGYEGEWADDKGGSIFQGQQKMKAGGGEFMKNDGSTHNTLGVAFYGANIRDQLSPGRIGYVLPATQLSILMQRIANPQSTVTSVSPRLAPHNRGLKISSNTPPTLQVKAEYPGKLFIGTPLKVQQIEWIELPLSWLTLLTDVYNQPYVKPPFDPAESLGIAIYLSPDFGNNQHSTNPPGKTVTYEDNKVYDKYGGASVNFAAFYGVGHGNTKDGQNVLTVRVTHTGTP